MLEWFAFEGLMLEAVQMVALVVVLAILLLAVAIFGELVVQTRKRLKAWGDSASVLAFGKSPVGGMAHDTLLGLVPKVDEADDKAIQQISAWLQIRKLGVDEQVFRQGLASALSDALQVGVDLVDGVPSEPPGE